LRAQKKIGSVRHWLERTTPIPGCQVGQGVDFFANRDMLWGKRGAYGDVPHLHGLARNRLSGARSSFDLSVLQ
jgi:hypothetical protein